MIKAIEKLVPDTSVIAEAIVSKMIESREVKAKIIFIHEAVVAELENQANKNRETGYIGLDELKRLQGLSKRFRFKIEFVGTRPEEFEVAHAKAGAIDAMIRSYAFLNNCTLVTADKVQALVAESKGMDVFLVEFDRVPMEEIRLETFFDESTMSVHLRENMKAVAKKGVPGNWRFVDVTKDKLERSEIQAIANEIVEAVASSPDGFVEIERKGSTIVQLGNYRIVIAKPPLADAWEITAVRPVKSLELDDYHLSEKLKSRIARQAEGILVAGSPGMGKSTFVSALAEFYVSLKKIVKTVEAPRDLQVSDNITQYAISRGSPAEIHDILLLSRPDYTIFDEMRNTSDFKLFADMRLAGVGMVGIVHATNPVDAIQRFIGRVEMGVIPQIVDTVIFIRDGSVGSVLSLEMTVKVPSGMTEADLARPVVVVSDFETGKPMFEIYSYGEQTVVMPVIETEKKGAFRLAERKIAEEFGRYAENVEVDVQSNERCTVYVPDHDVPAVIGKQGWNIEKIENKLGMKIDVQPLKKTLKKVRKKKPLAYDFAFSGKSVNIYLAQRHRDKDIDIYVDGEFLLTAKSSKKAVIKIKRSKVSNVLFKALKKNGSVDVYLS